MNDYYLNRLNMGRKVLACLNLPAHLPLWQNQPPLRLATVIGETQTEFAKLGTLLKNQTQNTNGSAADKRREEKELEDAAHELGRLVVRCLSAAGDEAAAATYDLPLSGWRRMRNEVLLQTARSLETKAAALAATPAGAEYGITAEGVAALSKEADDYDDLIVAPDSAISGKAALTKQVRPAFAAFEKQLQEIDDLILPLRRTEAGTLLVAKYQEARTINDRGRRPGTGDDEADPTPTPAPAEPK